MSQLIGMLRDSASWRVRLDVLLPLQSASRISRRIVTRADVCLIPLAVFYFHNLFLLDDEIIAELMEQLCDLLRDPKVCIPIAPVFMPIILTDVKRAQIEVREAAAATLSGVVRCSQRSSILMLRDRFMAIIRSNKIPKRRDAKGEEVETYAASVMEARSFSFLLFVRIYFRALLTLLSPITDSAVLGIAAIITAHPYEVPAFVPDILIECMTKYVTAPPPISTAVKACLAEFKATHQDGWAEDQKAFGEDQLLELNDLLTGSSYCTFLSLFSPITPTCR